MFGLAVSAGYPRKLDTLPVEAVNSWGVKPGEPEVKTCEEIYKDDKEKQKMCEENVDLRNALVATNQKLDKLRCLLYGGTICREIDFCSQDKYCEKHHTGILIKVKRWFDLDKKKDWWKIFKDIDNPTRREVSKQIFNNQLKIESKCNNVKKPNQKEKKQEWKVYKLGELKKEKKDQFCKQRNFPRYRTDIISTHIKSKVKEWREHVKEITQADEDTYAFVTAKKVDEFHFIMEDHLEQCQIKRIQETNRAESTQKKLDSVVKETLALKADAKKW